MSSQKKFDRRVVLGAVAAATPVLGLPGWSEAMAMPRLRITGFELLPVRATHRTVWLIVRLRTDAGLSGLGEASDAFGFDDTTKAEADRMERELRRFFALVDGKSPLDLGEYRRQGEPLAQAGGLISATAYSAVEQALWDLAGKALGVPASTLLGGRLRDSLPVYANINRATIRRTPEGFAATAKAAVADGFRALKAAPFDGFPPPGAPAAEVEAAIETGLAAMAAMREAVGADVELMVDCHAFFDVETAVRVAGRLQPLGLAWYEEPVAPEKAMETAEIRRRIDQPMAGGELLFGVAGFAPLVRNRAVHVIMPDVKHCGGLDALKRIAAVAEAEEISVAPHNPSGPVSTAASIQVAAVIKNFRSLELQWGEVDWRSGLLEPPERIENGTIRVPDTPGFGIELNEAAVKARLI